MKKNTKNLKKKLKIYNPKLKEGCGIVSYDGKNYHSEKRFGLVGDNFNNV